MNAEDDEILAAARAKAAEKLGSVERLQLQQAPQTNRTSNSNHLVFLSLALPIVHHVLDSSMAEFYSS